MRFEPLIGSDFSLSRGEETSLWSRGTVFKNEEPRPVGEVIPKDLLFERAGEVVSELDGFFSFVINKGQRVIAAVDRVRSFPLFYALLGDILFLGDNPYRIQEKLGDRQTDPLAVAELYLTGYVTGDSTFDPRISQIPAGEILSAEVDETGLWAMKQESFYCFHHHHDELNLPFEELIALGQEEMDGAVARMIRVAAGNLIVVPLSGGYDSRFILLTLKRLGYPHLAAFSYGVPGNEEAQVSRRVSEALDVPWYFVPYSPERWREWLDSPEYADYQLEGEKMVSVAHVQDWPAVWELKKRRIFPERTLLAPGHSGDFLGGKQIRPALLRKSGWNKNSVVREIWSRHYTNVSLNVALRETGSRRDAKDALLRRVEAHLDGWDVERLEGANNAYDFEFWQEKLSKFIVNSMRVYEFWGYRWWLPFYDRRLVSFWERIPLEWRVGKVLYDRIVEKLQENFGLKELKEKKRNLKQRIRAWLSFPLFELLIWRIHGMKKMLRNYVLEIQKTIPREDFQRYLGNGGNINGYLAALHHRTYAN
jgi:asparagine synthase (glutamine-hydrolysing)